MSVERIRVLICDSISKKGIELISSAGFEVSYIPDITSDELVKTISNFEVVIVRSRTKLTRNVIVAGKSLKAIGRAGVGLDNVDVEAANEIGAKVFNTPDALTNAVSELAIGLMLNLARGISLGDSSLRKDEWLKNRLMGVELKGKVLGIIGLGRIGKRIAELSNAFGMTVCYYDIIDIPDEVLKQLKLTFMELDELLSKCDFITLNIPLTPSTKHFINSDKLLKMKQTAYLINTSRGGVIDEHALYNSLKSGSIKGAALDVFEVEPPLKNELLTLPNMLCTPHIGAQTEEAQEIAAVSVSEKIIDFFKPIG